MSKASSKVAIIAEHIHHLLARHVSLHTRSSPIVPVPPLFVALQGPQGIGKTTLTSSLQDALHSVAQRRGRPTSPFEAEASLTPRPKVMVLSLDDFYLPHSAMVALACASRATAVSSEEENSPRPNKLLSGRGLPGTHDLPLLTSVLSNF
jgi:D-glycerate 3-kinase